MALLWLHLLACLVLAGAAIYRTCKHPHLSNHSHRFLFPFILFAGLSGIALLIPLASELFVATYSGAIYDLSAAWKVDYLVHASLLSSLLPAAAIFPAVGRRAKWVAVIAVIAALPTLANFAIWA